MAWSEPVALDGAQPHDVEIAMPSLNTVADATIMREPLDGRLRISVDGTVRWEMPACFYAAEAREIVIGGNLVGGTSCGILFTGDLLSAERISVE
jgi:hypothetical protein